MSKSYNYTGRKRISREHVSVRLSPGERDEPPAFSVKADLRPYALEGDAAVVVEAYHQTNYMRFHFGTVSEMRAPESTRLSGFADPDSVLFRLKVVERSRSKGLILAQAEQISPANAEGEEGEHSGNSILPVRFEDLGDEVWRIDVDDPRPYLLVNSTIVTSRDELVSNPAYAALIFPEVLRRVLMHVMIIEELGRDELSGWREAWVRFTKPFRSAEPVFVEAEEVGPTMEWIDLVVADFCRRLGLRRLMQENINR